MTGERVQATWTYHMQVRIEPGTPVFGGVPQTQEEAGGSMIAVVAGGRPYWYGMVLVGDRSIRALVPRVPE